MNGDDTKSTNYYANRPSPKLCLRHHPLTILLSPSALCRCGAILLILCQYLPYTVPILFQEDDGSTAGTKCFCDKKNCAGGALVCAGGRFCLVGVRHEDGAEGQGRLDQHCLDEAKMPLPQGKKCARDWHQWSEVCICEENLCNTWAFLRSQMDSPTFLAGTNFRHRSHKANAPAAERSFDNLASSDHSAAADDHQQRAFSPYGNDGGALLATDTDPLGFDRSAAEDTARYQRRGPALVLLLVVLPLVVGAFTVLLVFLNYHCNML